MIHYDTHALSLNKQGEELCGDQVKILRTAEKTLAVLSDGLGSGVKANILARLTAEILVTMLRERVPLPDVLQTVMGTLPTCRVRHIAYAAFVAVEVEHATGRCRVINFDCPPPFLIRDGRLAPWAEHVESLTGRDLRISEATLQRGDFVAVISDGVLYAGMGVTMNFGWGHEQIAAHMEKIAGGRPLAARNYVADFMKKTGELYGGRPGDDATLVGILARAPNRLMVFTGPPTSPTMDHRCADRLLGFSGRKVVCGGTTANIVAGRAGLKMDIDFGTIRDEIPPIGVLPGLDLVTEGILTLAATLRLLRDSQGDAARLGTDRNGATLLAGELLRADSIFILAGQKVNPYYQNPLLPKNISIRHNLLEQIAETLAGYHKTVDVEWC